MNPQRIDNRMGIRTFPSRCHRHQNMRQRHRNSKQQKRKLIREGENRKKHIQFNYRDDTFHFRVCISYLAVYQLSRQQSRGCDLTGIVCTRARTVHTYTSSHMRAQSRKQKEHKHTMKISKLVNNNNRMRTRTLHIRTSNVDL